MIEIKVILKRSLDCRGCKHLKNIKVETDFGIWSKICKKYEIGRENESESCYQYE